MGWMGMKVARLSTRLLPAKFVTGKGGLLMTSTTLATASHNAVRCAGTQPDWQRKRQASIRGVTGRSIVRECQSTSRPQCSHQRVKRVASWSVMLMKLHGW